MEDEIKMLEKMSLSFDKINNDMYFMKEEFSEVRLENRISIEEKEENENIKENKIEEDNINNKEKEKDKEKEKGDNK